MKLWRKLYNMVIRLLITLYISKYIKIIEKITPRYRINNHAYHTNWSRVEIEKVGSTLDRSSSSLLVRITGPTRVSKTQRTSNTSFNSRDSGQAHVVGWPL